MLGKPLKLSPGAIHPLCFCLQTVVLHFSWEALLSLSLLVSGQGLTCGTNHWLSKGVSNPSPASLEDHIFCWLLPGLFPEFSVVDCLRLLDPKYSSKAGVDECLYLNQCCSCGFPCFTSIQQDRF